MSTLPGGIITFLFTDVEGSTRKNTIRDPMRIERRLERDEQDLRSAEAR